VKAIPDFVAGYQSSDDEGMLCSIPGFFLLNDNPGDITPVSIPGDTKPTLSTCYGMYPRFLEGVEQPEVARDIGSKDYIHADRSEGLLDVYWIPSRDSVHK